MMPGRARFSHLTTGSGPPDREVEVPVCATLAVTGGEVAAANPAAEGFDDDSHGVEAGAAVPAGGGDAQQRPRHRRVPGRDGHGLPPPSWRRVDDSRVVPTSARWPSV